MSLWSKIQQLPSQSIQRIQSIYEEENFPIEVRDFLAFHIEKNFWSETDPIPDNPQHEQDVALVVNGFIDELENQIAVINDPEKISMKLRLEAAAKMFREKYRSNSMRLFRFLRHCLITEVQNVNSEMEIYQRMTILHTRTQDMDTDLKRLKHHQEVFVLQRDNYAQVITYIQHLSSTQPLDPEVVTQIQELTQQKEKLEEFLNKKMEGLTQLYLSIVSKFKESIGLLNQLQSLILDELKRWKREQQLAALGGDISSNLNLIQEWCESLVNLIWSTRQQVKEVDRLRQILSLESADVVNDLHRVCNEVTQLLYSLVNSSFIIEKQPVQVVKTNTRFTATVRLLVGGKLNVHMTSSQVKVTLVSEFQPNFEKASGDILNNTETMKYQEATKQLVAKFDNMHLKNICRGEKKGTESVMDKKFVLVFQTQFSVGELMFKVCTFSHPIVVTVHVSQDAQAWATVTWCNAFGDVERIPFTVPDKVHWSRVAEMLSLKFRSTTGRPLTEENLRFLADKAYCGSYNEASNPTLSWSQFCKEHVSDRSFTFWDWFYAAMKLTKDHLKSLWTDGAIIGFIKKKQAEEMLLSSTRPGTFLLRFADSVPGGITIAWISNKGQIFNLEPFTYKDLAIKSLADHVDDMKYLRYLYPNFDKDTIFGKYYTPLEYKQPTNNSGYVKRFMKTHIMDLAGITSPKTSQHLNLQSPVMSPSVVPSNIGLTTTVTTGDPIMHYADYNIDNIIDFKDPMINAMLQERDGGSLNN